MNNPIGIISMFYARPFQKEQFPLFARMKQCGMDFVELLVPEAGDFDVGEARKVLEGEGLRVLLATRTNAERDISSEDQTARQGGIDYLNYSVNIAAELGAPLIGGPFYGSPLVFAGRAPVPVTENERQRRISAVIDGLAQVTSLAETVNVRLALEPVNRYETDLVNTVRQGTELVRMVSSPALGLLLDTFHMNMEEKDLPSAIRDAGDLLFHFQANENDRGFVGSGHVDWTGVSRALAAVSYTGGITLEPFRRTDERIGVPLAQWRAPLRDEDGDLRQSADYLRTALQFGGAN
ncbi:sugar phosphate isomerase/epimerase family protein [Ahrensia kielensis]|uniref:Sugar phosphate isomerase/epimerase family protein n=1 Tax=Ahrensia kielensis TaxID=76980 RepID=A0ABU9T2I6_9HYPH